jgi:hypothetical protein
MAYRRHVTGLVVMLALLLPASALATWGNKCSAGNGQHCYATATYEMTGSGNGGGEEVKGLSSEIATTAMSVPLWESGNFVTNEQWMSDPRGYWIEDGQIGGYNLWTEQGREVNGNSLHWFYASELGGFIVYVAPWTYPGWTYESYTLSDPGNNGVWCAKIGATEVGESCRSGFRKYSNNVEVGMEAGDEQQPENAGLDRTGVQWTEGNWHNWAKAKVETVHDGGSPGESAYICAKANGSGIPGDIGWGSPNNRC